MADEEQVPAQLELDLNDPAIDQDTLPPELRGEPAAPEFVQQELVSVDIGGRTVSMTQEDALAYQLHESQLQQELAEARASQRSAPQVPSYADPYDQWNNSQGTEGAYDYEQQLFADPKGAIQHLKDEIRAELTQEYTVERDRLTFWDTFYRENTGLQGKETLVNAVLQEKLDEIGGLKGKVARDALATATKAKILELIGENRATGQQQARPAGDSNTLESASNQVVPPAPAGGEGGPVSLSDAIKARRRGRV